MPMPADIRTLEAAANLIMTEIESLYWTVN